jgi:hypothetical protein
MFSPTSLFGVQSLFSSHAGVVPMAGGAITGLAVAVFRGSGLLANPFGLRGARSLMNFSSQGTLRCICGIQHREGGIPDRRQFCRSCGCEVVRQDAAMLDKQLTRREIAEMTRSLQRAASRASHLDLPPSVTTIDELHRYLASSEPKNPRTPPTRPSSVEQTQVH